LADHEYRLIHGKNSTAPCGRRTRLGIISETNENVAPDSGMSFYDKATWYVFIAPFAIVAIGYVSICVVEHLSISRLADDHAEWAIITGALILQFISFILALSICCRFQQHRRKFAIWIAVLGILASCGLGFLTLAALAMNRMG
jgi:hypothetical protein